MIAAIDANAGRSFGSSTTARAHAATAATAVCSTALTCGRRRRRTVVATARGVSLRVSGTARILTAYAAYEELLRVPEKCEDGEHASVVVVARRQVQLAEDARDVLLDRAGLDDHRAGD